MMIVIMLNVVAPNGLNVYLEATILLPEDVSEVRITDGVGYSLPMICGVLRTSS
jgi:hypothetical protein